MPFKVGTLILCRGALNAEQGCQMVNLQTKNSTFGYILEVFGIEMLVYIFWLFVIFYNNLLNFTAILQQFGMFTAIWYMLQQCGIFYSNLVHFTAIKYMYFTAIWYILQPLCICILQQFGTFCSNCVYAFHSNLLYFTAICYILLQFGIFLLYVLYRLKSGNTDANNKITRSDAAWWLEMKPQKLTFVGFYTTHIFMYVHIYSWSV
jgi:hypothetical protein